LSCKHNNKYKTPIIYGRTPSIYHHASQIGDLTYFPIVHSDQIKHVHY